MNKLDIVESARLRTDIPPFRPGDQVKVHVNIREGGRERVQVFEGVVLARRGGGLRESFTVRKVSFGVGVERTFPVHAPAIAKIEIVRHGKVRRAKLYYLRELTGKKAKIEERRTRIPTWGEPEEPTAEDVATATDEAEPTEAAEPKTPETAETPEASEVAEEAPEAEAETKSETEAKESESGAPQGEAAETEAAKAD